MIRRPSFCPILPCAAGLISLLPVPQACTFLRGTGDRPPCMILFPDASDRDGLGLIGTCSIAPGLTMT